MQLSRALVISLLVVSCYLLGACRAQNTDGQSQQAAKSSENTVATVQSPSQLDCETKLLGWMEAGLVLGVPQARSTDAGCDMTFDVSGAESISGVKALITTAFEGQGYALSNVTAARGGERLMFDHPNGTRISLLLRGKDAVKITMPDSKGQAYVHWYVPGEVKE